MLRQKFEELLLKLLSGIHVNRRNNNVANFISLSTPASLLNSAFCPLPTAGVHESDNSSYFVKVTVREP